VCSFSFSVAVCLQQIQRLFEHTTGFVRFPVRNGPLELPINFLFKKSAPDRIKRSAHGHNLGQYVSTLMSFVPETLETGGVEGKDLLRQKLALSMQPHLCLDTRAQVASCGTTPSA
jgi:hypothetical protein